MQIGVTIICAQMLWSRTISIVQLITDSHVMISDNFHVLSMIFGNRSLNLWHRALCIQTLVSTIVLLIDGMRSVFWHLSVYSILSFILVLTSTRVQYLTIIRWLQ